MTHKSLYNCTAHTLHGVCACVCMRYIGRKFNVLAIKRQYATRGALLYTKWCLYSLSEGETACVN